MIRTIALSVNSNPLNPDRWDSVHQLTEYLKNQGITAICSKYIFESSQDSIAIAKGKAAEFQEFFKSPDIDAIFDISGGDAANLILDYIDWHIIAENPKPFFGISDNSVLLNALTVKANTPTFHYAISNLTGVQNPSGFLDQIQYCETRNISLDLESIQPGQFSASIVGGNIRCFLKLAGTEYFPSFKNKILFLESLGGNTHRIASYFRQISMLSDFNQLSGIIFGTFTQLQSEMKHEDFLRFLRRLTRGLTIPIAYTNMVGHGMDSKILPFGKQVDIVNSAATETGINAI
jgi:muramoyltetrapeptide carboxypeptidase